MRITGLGFDHVGSVLVAKIPTPADRVDGDIVVPDTLIYVKKSNRRQVIPAAYVHSSKCTIVVVKTSTSMASEPKYVQTTDEQDQHFHGIRAEVRANY